MEITRSYGGCRMDGVAWLEMDEKDSIRVVILWICFDVRPSSFE